MILVYNFEYHIYPLFYTKAVGDKGQHLLTPRLIVFPSDNLLFIFAFSFLLE